MKFRLKNSRTKGFALVVTLTLMILLTVIAVGLLTLSSITLRSVGQGSALATARANARLAMMLALGDLQKFAGKDQRVTAQADIAGTATGESLAAGAAPLNDKSVTNAVKGLSAVQPGTRHWTGVFANRDIVTSVYTKTPSPNIVQWLVSGSSSDYPTGGPSLLPSDSSYAVGSGGKVSDEKKAVVLVGANTVGSGANSIDQYVVAPVIPVKSATSTNPTGAYAYWVGDEGSKARIDMSRTLEDSTKYASLSAQRRGWETIAGFENYPTPGSGNQADLSKSLTLAGTELVVPGIGSPVSGSSPLQNVFHSATTDSRTLLTDTLNGGTKIDLTSILDGDLPTTNPVTSLTNYPVKGTAGRVIPRDGARSMRAPMWDAVKEFHDRYKQLSGGSLIVTSSKTDISAAIAPIITDFRVLMGAKIRIKDANTGTFFVDACGKIAVSIANPYSYPLKWNEDLEIELRNQTPVGNFPSRIFSLAGQGAPAFIPANTAEPAVFNQAFFRIKAGSLPAGEARAFTLGAPVIRAAGSGTRRVVIDLVPFATSNPGSMNNCIILENATTYTAPLNMDVRESWTTSLALVEMKLAGSSSRDLLRKIERFEFDNGYYAPTQRSFSKEQAARMTSPFPLMLYSFQVSQPGGDYKNLMPSTYDLGLRSSTLRTFTDFNLQATRIQKPIASYNPPPYFVESADSLALLPAAEPGGLTGAAFTRNLAVSPLPWGRSPFGAPKTILFSVPTNMSSLAGLQHADLTGDDTFASIGHQPGNAVGNSYAPPFVKRSLTTQNRTNYELTGSGSVTTPSNVNYYDISYLLNASLWDSYYFSTVEGSTSIPENPTLVKLDASSPSSELKDPVEAATQLVVEGGFNVNSTDKNAWKAFLASSKHFKHLADSGTNADAAFPRSLEQVSPSVTPPTGDGADSFSGFRRLTDAQLDSLATEIVKQVRMRGPFVSLSQFVNRAIATIETQPALTRSGALQSAIDESGANISFDRSKNGFKSITATRDAVTLLEKSGAPRGDYDGGNTSNRPSDASSEPDWAKSSTDSNFGAVASIIADRKMLTDARYKPEQGYRSSGIPGWLTQADVLQVIGPALSARSDTFRIRTMGEAYDASGKSLAKAYCEAIVQRVPDYVDPSNAPSTRGTSLSTINQTYGRQFQIVQFRWLSPNEI